jgi:hypothetical protein
MYSSIFNNAGLSWPALLAVMRNHFLLILCLGLAVRVFPQTPPPPSPGIIDIVGEELNNRGHRANDRKMWGTFTITNPGLTPFILRMTFHGRAGLMNEAWTSRIPMRDLELRYRNQSNMTIRKTFSAGTLGSGGFVYELHFLEEDMQPVYRMELWSSLAEPAATRALPGIYREQIDFEIEVKP